MLRERLQIVRVLVFLVFTVASATTEIEDDAIDTTSLNGT